MTQTATKVRTLTLINRHELADGTIVYRFSNDQGVRYIVRIETDGTTRCINLATEEECKGHQYAHCSGHDCYHVLEAQRLELIDPEYEAWKKANGLDQPLTREQYVQANGIYSEGCWTGEFFTSPAPEQAEVPAEPAIVEAPVEPAWQSDPEVIGSRAWYEHQQWLKDAEKRACDAVIQAYLDRVATEINDELGQPLVHRGLQVPEPAFPDSDEGDYKRWTSDVLSEVA